ncbi:RHS repeat-associated core domain-containing protein [Paracidovorax citrulli]
MQVLLALDSTEDDDSDAPALGRNFFAALPRAQRDLLEGVLHSAIGTCAEASLANLSSNLPLDVRVLLANGLDEIRGRRTNFARAEDTCIRHILCDHLGTPIAMVDANGRHSGLLTWAATYHSWGALREEYNPNDISQPIRFQGQQFDAETGLHYNRLRYYDPSLGQYLTQDPIGLLGGNDKYIYPVSPTGWIDPTGLNPLAACAVPGPTMAACAVAAEKAMSLLALGTAALATAMIPSSTSQMSDAERLSSAHEAAMGNRTAPGYGENCSPEEHDALRDKKEKACDDAKGLSCQKGELNYGKAEKIQKCIDARINIARKCFAGGDAGHNEQINQLFRIIGKCTGHNAR